MDQVKQEQIRMLHRMSPPSFVISYAVALMLVGALWSWVERSFLVAWLIVFSLVTFSRWLLAYHFNKSDDHQRRPERWARIYCGATLIAGVLWGLLGMQYDPLWPPVHQIMLFTTLVALIAGAVASHACYFPALASFYSPVLISLVWVTATQDDPAFLWCIPMIAAFWAIIYVGGRRFSKLLKANIHFQQSLASANERLELIAKLDSLTKLNNRGALEQYLNEIWPIYQRRSSPVSIAMIDVDKFKAYNDFYGHLEGDRCLTHIANVLRLVVPEDLGFIGRYGGEEFIAVLPNTDSKKAWELMRHAQEALEKEHISHAHSGVSSLVTVSIGLATLTPCPEKNWTTLIDKADANLYIAKQRGRDQIVA